MLAWLSIDWTRFLLIGIIFHRLKTISNLLDCYSPFSFDPVIELIASTVATGKGKQT
jgi:hypothetical protein